MRVLCMLVASFLLGACGGGGGGGNVNSSCPYSSCSSFESHTYAILRPATPTPQQSLVIFLHGREETREQTDALWAAQTFATNNPAYTVAIPQGNANIWNFTSDVDWMFRFVNYLQTNEGPFRNVYLVGYSNGSILSQQVACRQTGEITGVVSFAGPRLSEQPSPCSPTAPVAVSLIHGSADQAVPIGGSYVWGTEGAQQSFDFWAAHNMCTGDIQTSAPFNLESNLMATTRSARNCQVPVELTISNGGGHTPSWNVSVLHQTLIDFFERARR